MSDGLDEMPTFGTVVGFGMRGGAGYQMPLDAIALTARDYGAACPYDRAPEDALGGGCGGSALASAGRSPPCPGWVRS